MNKYLFTIYRILVPKPLRTIILKKSLRYKILNYFASLPENEVNDEQKEVLQKKRIYLLSRGEDFPLSFHPILIKLKYFMTLRRRCDMSCRKVNGYILKSVGVRKRSEDHTAS